MNGVATTLSLALWATDLGGKLNGIAAWVERIGSQMDKARQRGADLLVMPEYACEQWLSFRPDGLAPHQELAWIAAQVDAAVDLLKPLVERYQTALLAGTFPYIQDGALRNRAILLLPDGRVVHQDKLCLTPGERDPENWSLEPGQKLQLIEWRGIKLAILICLDVELPQLSSMLAPHQPDLILVPSMTSTQAGYSRVFGCAKARAVELMSIVAACGTTGATPGTTQCPTNVSGCSVFLPCEPSLGYHGILDQIGPVDGCPDGGPLLITGPLPVDEIRALRSGGADVWPGAWSGRDVSVISA